ncbi:hypothetical protein [Pseudoalteromonas sp. Z1A8]|uniref:hypothetical protein n=1 Tax=Pseudoalteromonas sp. Z1A8 TaxID=2686354 RepID=UPI001408B464|nr:hypothetical protein [Pseudoalteromonas sp. Z1A8]
MSNWKQNLQKFRYVMDTLLLISFMLVSAPQATGVPLHEWFSLFFIAVSYTQIPAKKLAGIFLN